jgi:predicted nucleotide-binding protein
LDASNKSAGSMPRKPFEHALYDFQCMSERRSHSLIVRYFVEQLIHRSDICEQGSILVYNPPRSHGDSSRGALKLYDELKATNLNSIIDFPSADFSIDEGLAGLVFRKRAPEYAPLAQEHPDFQLIPGQDIRSIYCLPIILDDREEPFGVVNFHNSRAGGEIDRRNRKLIQIAVKSLEAMLSLTPLSKRLVPKEKVFIVHGRNKAVLADLENILAKEGLDYVVIQSLARTGQDLLTFIEDRIRDCVAGFVLLTPDDEGRVYQFGEPMRQRARQNVIFEGGYLMALFRGTNRVCFVQQGDVEMPSDLNGLLMERFEERLDPERIHLTLQEWGLPRHFEDHTLPSPASTEAAEPVMAPPTGVR